MLKGKWRDEASRFSSVAQYCALDVSTPLGMMRVDLDANVDQSFQDLAAATNKKSARII